MNRAKKEGIELKPEQEVTFVFGGKSFKDKVTPYIKNGLWHIHCNTQFSILQTGELTKPIN